MKQYKICGVVTRAFGIRAFMIDNLKYVQANGFDASFVCEKENFSREELDDVVYHPIEMSRGFVSPIEILRVVCQLTKLFKKEKYDIVQYSSSNAGLYAAIASWLARVPVRIYCMWGLTYVAETGFSRFFYKNLERVISLFSTDVQPDSHANMKIAIKDHLVSPKKIDVIHKGSATGVNLEKFNIKYKKIWREKIRKQYNIPVDAKVIGYVGRLVPEKGLNELFEAFNRINDNNVYMLMVGPNYNIEGLNQKLYKVAVKNKHIIFVGSVSNPSKYYAAMDWFSLPSYREGFGSVVIEAASLGVPTICSNIDGPTDFVKDGENGLICEVKSVNSLYNVIVKALALTDADYCKLSRNAYEAVKNDFDSKIFKQYFLQNRLELIQKHVLKK